MSELETQVAVLQQELAERKQVEAELRQNEERLRLAFNAAQTSYWLLLENARDIVLFIRVADRHIIEANQAALAAYGYDHATLLTKTLYDLRDPTTHHLIPEQMRQTLTSGSLFETRHCRSDGSIFPVEVSARVADVAGERLILSIIRDISERKQVEDDLRHSQERLQVVLRAGRMGWWERDLRTDEVIWSDGFLDLLGQIPAGSQPNYAMILQRVHPDDRPKLLSSVRRAIDERDEYSAEFRLLHPNGGLRWVMEKGRIFYDQADQPQRMVGVSLDMTQRKWVEEGLRESEATLRSFYDNTPLLMGLVEINQADILHLYDNPATYRFYGLQANTSTTGQWASKLGLPSTAIATWLKHLQATEASKQPVHFEYLHDTPGNPRWLAATVSAIGPGHSGRTRFCYVAEDITERKRDEETLRRQAALIELSYEPTFIWDVDKGIIEWNKGCQQLYGYSKEEALGQSSHLLLKTVHPLPTAKLLDVLEHEGSWSGELRHITRDRREVLVESRHQLFETSGQRLVLETNHDITARKRAEVGQQLLAEMGRLLATSLNVTERLTELAEIAVATKAEWCAVNLVEADGTIRLAAAAHHEPTKTALVYELAGRYPLDPAASTGTPQALRTGQAHLYPDFIEATLAQRPHDPAYRHLLAQLGGQEAIITPLVVSERVLGSITFVSKQGQAYDPTDLSLLEELGRRVAFAVDNARLYEAERTARAEAETAQQQLARLVEAGERNQPDKS